MTLLCRIFRDPANRDAGSDDGIILRRHAAAGVLFDNLVVNKTDGSGEPLIDFGRFRLSAGDRMMLTGPSGCGKSSALCALKDAWIFGGSGGATLPPDEAIKFVPQDDYFPDLTLRGIVCAPREAAQFSDAQVKDALREAGLEDFIPLMDDDDKRGEYWKSTLSGGQKKRIAIAGVFLQAPLTKLLILDEVTSALDAAAEKDLYAKILAKLRHGVVISIVHRMEIGAMHNVVATAADGRIGYERREAPPNVKPAQPARDRYPPRPWRA